MADLEITPTGNDAGDGSDMKYGAEIADTGWTGGGSSEKLVLRIGDKVIDIWPATPRQMESLADDLLKLARSLRKKRRGQGRQGADNG